MLDFACDSFATCVDAIVREAAGVALRYQDLDFIFGKPLAERVTDLFEMVWVAPKSGGC